jgi:hypothetical protein
MLLLNELPTDVKTLLAFDPISRTVPPTSTRITASMTDVLSSIVSKEEKQDVQGEFLSVQFATKGSWRAHPVCPHPQSRVNHEDTQQRRDGSWF